jgi:hypothetical protein
MCCCVPELNVLCPDGFEYSFVDEEFVAGREFGLASEEPVHLGQSTVAPLNCSQDMRTQ